MQGGGGLRMTRRLCVLLLLVVRQAETQTFPVDRDDCDPESTTYDYQQCISGEPWMAAFFPTVLESYDLVFATGFLGILNPTVMNALAKPDGYVIDYSGGLTLPPEDYKPLDRYINAEGDVTFVHSEINIIVNDTGFSPTHINIMPGTTVSWVMETYESASVKSEDEPPVFNSGPLNRNWAPTYKHRFDAEGVFHYRNAEQQRGNAGFNGRVVVTQYNCSSYTTCTTCLAYDQCLWCGANGTCIERNLTTNLPLDDEPVAALTYNPGREYQSIKYMFGYNTKLAIERFDWYPWPPIQRNPRPVLDPLVVDAANFLGDKGFDPISSKQCSAYLRTRDASQCDNYVTPLPKNRVHGRETGDRPQLDDFFTCYEHLEATWAKPDLEEPIPWTEWALTPPPPPPSVGGSSTAFNWTGACCDLCATCASSVLSACNVSCGVNVMNLPFPFATCPATPFLAGAIRSNCGGAAHNATCNATSTPNSAMCLAVMAEIEAQIDVNATAPLRRRLDGSVGDGRLSPPSQEPLLDDSESIMDSMIYSHEPTESFVGEVPSIPTSFSGGDVGSLQIMEEYLPRPGRRVQAVAAEATVSEWQQVPQAQRNKMPQLTMGMDLWLTLKNVLHGLYGPRCNATERCDLARGSCLNISNMPIYGYDQNGTCVCHPWYTGDDCSVVKANEQTCQAMPDVPQCQRIRDKLYLCGHVEHSDFLPKICADLNLTVVECGEAGHMKGLKNKTGISNLIGRPEAGYAANTCSMCLSRGDMRMDTYAKLCDRSIVLAACQRYEDATAQRLCNMCGRDTQLSVMPQRGMTRGCSYYRGTCIGSVEKRIRGIVPPNADIVGQTKFGGLRYCKLKTTFSSVQHYYTDNDIMQVGQTCLEGTTAVYEDWDWSKQRDHPNTVKDQHGLACADPSDENTCPIARFCVDASLCYTDTPNWFSIDELITHWGLNTIKQYADDPTCDVWLGSDTTSVSTPSTAGGIGAVLDEDAPVLVPCTFDTHKLIFFPSTAPDYANWPYVSNEYIESYTRVTWSLEGQEAPPPPNPPPPTFMVFG